MASEGSLRGEQFGAMVEEVMALVNEAAADPGLTYERAAALSRATENIVTAIQGLIPRLRLEGADTGFLAALEGMLQTLRAADLQAGKLVIQAVGILSVA